MQNHNQKQKYTKIQKVNNQKKSRTNFFLETQQLPFDTGRMMKLGDSENLKFHKKGETRKRFQQLSKVSLDENEMEI